MSDETKTPIVMCESCGENPAKPLSPEYRTGEDIDDFCEECRDYEWDLENEPDRQRRTKR